MSTWGGGVGWGGFGSGGGREGRGLRAGRRPEDGREARREGWGSRCASGPSLRGAQAPRASGPPAPTPTPSPSHPAHPVLVPKLLPERLLQRLGAGLVAAARVAHHDEDGLLGLAAGWEGSGGVAGAWAGRAKLLGRRARHPAARRRAGAAHRGGQPCAARLLPPHPQTAPQPCSPFLRRPGKGQRRSRSALAGGQNAPPAAVPAPPPWASPPFRSPGTPSERFRNTTEPENGG